MEFRRGGQSSQRRRRVLKDENLGGADEASEIPVKRRGRGAGVHARPYSDAALVEHQPRVTDLIPKRPWTLLVMVLSALLAIVVVQALYTHRQMGVGLVGAENLRSLDPTQRGSLAGWLSSSLLCMAAVAGVAVFSIRRHRLDDYKGRYRLWLVVPVLCILASIDATTGLHRVGRGMFELVTTKLSEGPSLASNATFWWVAGVLTVAVAGAVRLGIEMRRSLGATAWLLLALAAYTLVGAVETRHWLADLGMFTTQVESSAKLLGDMAVFCALATYARYVYLDSQGILAQRRAEREARRRKRAAEKAARREAKQKAAEERAAAKLAAKEAKRTKRDEVETSKAKAESEDDDEVSQDRDSDGDEQEEDGERDGDEAEERNETPKFVEQKPTGAPPKVTPAQITAQQQQSKPTADEDEDEDDDQGNSNLSRAERRRLKKLNRREVRKAA